MVKVFVRGYNTMEAKQTVKDHYEQQEQEGLYFLLRMVKYLYG